LFNLVGSAAVDASNSTTAPLLLLLLLLLLSLHLPVLLPGPRSTTSWGDRPSPARASRDLPPATSEGASCCHHHHHHLPDPANNILLRKNCSSPCELDNQQTC
jgi:hypothetical protein